MAWGLLRPGSATAGGAGQPLRRRRGRAAPNGHRRRRRRAASQPYRAGPRSAGSRPPRARRRRGGRGARRCRAAIHRLATSRGGSCPQAQHRGRQGRSVDCEAGRRDWSRGRSGPGRGRESGTGKRAADGLLEGCDGLLAVGQVVERLPRIPRRVAARPADQDIGPAIAHLELEQLLHLMFCGTVRSCHGGGGEVGGRRRDGLGDGGTGGDAPR